MATEAATSSDIGIRIGLHSGQQYQSFVDLRDVWQRAEALGFDFVSLFDHQRPHIDAPDGPCLDGLTALAGLAASTERVRCAILVVAPAHRNIGILASQAATIDQISRGRLELGLGVGGSDHSHVEYGLPQPRWKYRVRALAETCEALGLLWHGGPVTYRGAHVHLRGARLVPGPVQQDIPLVLGGMSDDVMALAARYATTWNGLANSANRARATLTRLDRACEAAGRDPRTLRRSITFRAAIVRSSAEARRAEEHAGSAAGGRKADLAEYLGFGTAPELVDLLSGFLELGVQDFVLAARPPIDYDTIERYATEVAPQLSGRR